MDGVRAKGSGSVGTGVCVSQRCGRYGEARREAQGCRAGWDELRSQRDQAQLMSTKLSAEVLPLAASPWLRAASMLQLSC